MVGTFAHQNTNSVSRQPPTVTGARAAQVQSFFDPRAVATAARAKKPATRRERASRGVPSAVGGLERGRKEQVPRRHLESPALSQNGLSQNGYGKESGGFCLSKCWTKQCVPHRYISALWVGVVSPMLRFLHGASGNLVAPDDMLVGVRRLQSLKHCSAQTGYNDASTCICLPHSH